jgi:GNAT superfamily N-acetyltransferase
MGERLWTTRAYAPGDEAGILALRRATFGDADPIRLKPEVWRWQFADNPAGVGYVQLADHAGATVGQYAAIPTRFLVAGTERTLAMSCDTMTHPNYQKQGIFVTLARELYTALETHHRVGVVWGFPNANSRPGFLSKLEWFDVYRYPLWVKPLRSRAVLERYLKSPRLAGALAGIGDRLWHLVAPRPVPARGCVIREITAFDDRFAELWRCFRDLAPIVQVRDPAYLRWRYHAVPEFGYRTFEVVIGGALAGYFVLRVLTLFDMRLCAVVDLFPCPIGDARVMREVLSFAQRHAEAEQAAFLTALLPPVHAGYLKRFGFLSVPGFANARPWYLGCRCPGADTPLFRDVNNWYMTYGDVDII